MAGDRHFVYWGIEDAVMTFGRVKNLYWTIGGVKKHFLLCKCLETGRMVMSVARAGRQHITS